MVQERIALSLLLIGMCIECIVLEPKHGMKGKNSVVIEKSSYHYNCWSTCVNRKKRVVFPQSTCSNSKTAHLVLKSSPTWAPPSMPTVWGEISALRFRLPARHSADA